MGKLLASILSGIGVLASGATTTVCLFFIDEPSMSKKMIER